LPDGFDQIQFARFKDTIQTRLESLSASDTCQRDQAIFWLYYEQGYTAKEIALLPNMKLSVKGVESTLLRLVKFVKDGLPGSAGAAGEEES